MSSQDLFEYLLRLGDTALILAQRLSEWCGKGPALEEDMALANAVAGPGWSAVTVSLTLGNLLTNLTAREMLGPTRL